MEISLKYYKYPRTLHLPWSPGLKNDDRVLSSTSQFEGKNVVVTEKMDGENTTMSNDRIYARSVNSGDHISRHYVKGIFGRVKNLIPSGWRVCGENLYAKHSIYYQNLNNYFLVFNIWNEENVCLSWEDTKEWVDLFGLTLVPVIYEGKWDIDKIKNLNVNNYNKDPMEGYVVRIKSAIKYDDFGLHPDTDYNQDATFVKYVGKYVRKNHVSTDTHWKHQEMIINKLKSLDNKH